MSCLDPAQLESQPELLVESVSERNILSLAQSQCFLNICFFGFCKHEAVVTGGGRLCFLSMSVLGLYLALSKGLYEVVFVSAIGRRVFFGMTFSSSVLCAFDSRIVADIETIL